MPTWSRVLSREVQRSARVVLLGVGHLARSDDAAGPLVVRSLLSTTPPLAAKALAIAAEEAPENFTGTIRAFAPDLTVIIDASRSGRPPGTIFLVDPDELADEDSSTHRIPLSRLARYIRETMDCRVLLVAIEATSLEEKMEGKVSPDVARAARNVARVLRLALAGP